MVVSQLVSQLVSQWFNEKVSMGGALHLVKLYIITIKTSIVPNILNKSELYE